MTKIMSVLDDGPAGAVDIFDADTAFGAFSGVDNVLCFAFGDSADGAFVVAGAALDAVFGNLIGHGGLLKGRTIIF
jgi:hypothetical protein